VNGRMDGELPAPVELNREEGPEAA